MLEPWLMTGIWLPPARKFYFCCWPTNAPYYVAFMLSRELSRDLDKILSKLRTYFLFDCSYGAPFEEMLACIWLTNFLCGIFLAGILICFSLLLGAISCDPGGCCWRGIEPPWANLFMLRLCDFWLVILKPSEVSGSNCWSLLLFLYLLFIYIILLLARFI